MIFPYEYKGEGIYYARLRKFAAGEIKELNEKEVKLIHDYLIQLANIFVIKEIE